MEPRARLAIIAAQVAKSGSQLESVFRAHGFGAAFRKSGDGAGKEQGINDALAADAKKAEGDDLFRDAVRHFALDDQSPGSVVESLRRHRTTPFEVQRVRRLHPYIQAASAALLRDGHPGSAILEAFKAVELRVKRLSGMQGQSGKKPHVSCVQAGRSCA